MGLVLCGIREPAEERRLRRQISDAPRGGTEGREITPTAPPVARPFAGPTGLRKTPTLLPILESRKLALRQDHTFSNVTLSVGGWSGFQTQCCWTPRCSLPLSGCCLRKNLRSRGGLRNIHRGSAHPWSCGSKTRVNPCPGGCRGSFCPRGDRQGTGVQQDSFGFATL